MTVSTRSIALAFPSALVTTLLLSVAPAAHAQFIQNTTGIDSPGTTVTFSEVPLAVNTVVTNQFAAFGVTFSGLFYDPQPFPAPNQSSPVLANFNLTTEQVFPTFSIFFDTAQTSAAFSFISNAGTSTFTALNNGVVVANASAPTNLTRTDNFYGFTGITFDEIRVSPGGSNLSGGIDNLQFGSRVAPPVPEPGAIATGSLIGATMLLGMIRGRRRKGTSQAA